MMEPGQKILFKIALTAHRDGNLTRAQQYYEQILTQSPHQPEVAYNLALLHISQENITTAITLLEKVLNINPAHLDALNNLGALMLKTDQSEQALHCFSTVITIEPDHTEARNNLAATLLQMDRYFHAAQHYKTLLEQTPDDIGARYSYGIALMESDDLQEAIHQFENILVERPNHLNAQSNLGIAHLKKGNTEKAKAIFNKVLAENPDRPEISYLYSALTGDNIPEKPPQQYIQHLFDQYAKNYDAHMTTGLAYEAPQKLKVLLDNNFEIKDLKIADLGCGTGLSGSAFKSSAILLHGVDLSPKMLALAEQKNIYDKVFPGDLVDFLKNSPLPYDLLLAADTLNYFGDLTEFFHGAHHALTPSGLILFSLEDGEDNKLWALQKSGRYTHSENYIRQKCRDHGFDIIALEKSSLRRQNHELVMGWLCLLQRNYSL
ncbi:MAG TPA: tetratricopeptide repeat protein [Gammaproteobacteria bacterium]|nr:tetratricopeptide repeat protein [Gammaproteobacteria bacterium]